MLGRSEVSKYDVDGVLRSGANLAMTLLVARSAGFD
jgi:hypothetical protein